MLLSKTFRASWSIGLAAALLAAVPPGPIARAENIVGDGGLAAHLLDAAASEGVFRHLRALQDIASVSGGNRAAGSPGYDRSAEYVAERLKEAGYLVQLEEFEFPFFEERVPPVLLVSTPEGRQEPARARWSGAAEARGGSGSMSNQCYFSSSICILAFNGSSCQAAGYLGASAYLCRMLAFTHRTLVVRGISAGVACINRKRGAKLAEESASMGLLAW